MAYRTHFDRRVWLASRQVYWAEFRKAPGAGASQVSAAVV